MFNESQTKLQLKLDEDLYLKIKVRKDRSGKKAELIDFFVKEAVFLGVVPEIVIDDWYPDSMQGGYGKVYDAEEKHQEAIETVIN